MIEHLRLLGQALAEVFVVPVRNGMPRPRGWPTGLAPVMVLAGVGYLIAVAMVLGAPALREVERLVIIDGSQVIGAASLTLFTWLVTLTLAIGLTAALHVWVPIRLVAILLLISPMLPMMAARGGSLTAAAGLLGIIVFALIRSRARFAAWEFPVVWLLVCLTVLVPLRTGTYLGYDPRTVTMVLLLTILNTLAVPALMMAGLTAAQLSTSLAQWLGYRAPEAMSRPVMVTIALTLAAGNLVWAGWQTVGQEPPWGWQSWLGAAALLVLALVFVGLLRTALPRHGRQRRDDPAEPDELSSVWQPMAYGLAALVLVPLLVNTLVAVIGVVVTLVGGHQPNWLAALPGSTAIFALTRVLQVIVACWLGWRRARRGDATAALVLGSFAAVMTMSAGPLLIKSWLPWDPEPIGVIFLVAMVVLWFRSGRQGAEHQLLVIALLVSLYQFRQLLADPYALFAAASAAALLLISLLWRALTDGALTRGDSRRFPQASRVLGYATMMLLGVQTVAITAQIRITDSTLDQTPMIEFGDRTLGSALFVAAGLAALAALWRARQRPRPQPQ